MERTSLDLIDEIEDLSPRNRAIFLAGVRGGDGDEGGDATTPPVPPTEGDDENAPAEGGAAPAEGEVPADGEIPAAEGTEPVEGTETEGEPITVADLPADMSAATVESLHATHAQLGEARDRIRETAATQADVDMLRQIKDRRNAIVEELQRRVDTEAAVRDGLASLDAELAEELSLPEPAVPVASVTPPAPSSAQIAAARGRQANAAQQPTPKAPRSKAALVAGVGGREVSVGNEMSISQLGDALDRTKRSSARTIVASIQPFDEDATINPEEMLSHRHGAERNSELMREAQAAWRAANITGDTRVAAICDPLDIIRQIPDAFNTAQPVRDVFPSRPAGRLGFQFIRSVGLADLAGSTVTWDETDQSNVDPDDSSTWKPCLPVDCPTPEEIRADAVTACLSWDITMEMSSPENLQNLMNALKALFARTKEGRILQRYDALSSGYNFASSYGAVPAVIAALNTAIGMATFADRLNEETYTVILPPTVVQLLVIDMASRGYNNDTVVDVLGYVRDRVEGVREVVGSLDASLSGQPGLPPSALNPPGAAAVDLPELGHINNGVHRLRLLDPSSFIYAETGVLNMGTERDANLIRQNRTQYFEEEFLLLTKNGPAPSFYIDTTICADGARAGLIEPVGCPTS